MSRARPRLNLIEAALLICLLGVVLAVFVPTFLRRVRTNKISEASELLQEMSDRTAAYYATSWDSGRRHCLPPPAGPTPEVPTMDSVHVDFYAPTEEGNLSWEALGFQPLHSTRYSYSYAPSRYGCELTGGEGDAEVVFRAHGDLDGDGVRSTFERRARLEAGRLQAATTLRVHQRIE